MILLWAGLAHALDHHVLHEGETLLDVAQAEGVPVGALRALNRLAAKDLPPVGTVLLLPGAESSEPAAIVLSVSGTGTAALPGEAAVPLSTTRALPVGTLVCTDPGGHATLRLATAPNSHEHDDVTMLGGTCLTLDASWARDERRASVVSVRRGSIAVLAAAEGTGAVTVRTGASVSTSTTGGFRVTVEEGASRTEALDGPVEVMGAGAQVSLTEGTATRVRDGEAPAAPVALLAAGAPRYPNEKTPLRRPDFAWAPVDRALGYRVEIASTPDFTTIVLAEDVGSSPWRPETLFLPFDEGALWWRISSFDRTGFLGAPSVPARIVLPVGVGP